jgi:serine/threonine protein kinase
MFHQPSSGLDQPLLQAGQRPVLNPSRQTQPPPQIPQVVGQQAQRLPHLVGAEPMTREAIIHRDIKPDNIIVTPDDANALLVDFGIALTEDDVKKLTGTGYAIGTPAYMSPEQSNEEKIDGTSIPQQATTVDLQWTGH